VELGGKILQEGVADYAVKSINPAAVKGAVLSAGHMYNSKNLFAINNLFF
jgi:hypothetical protein